MIMEPSWSTISRSSCEGGEQNRCWKIWSTDSTVLGVSFRATAMCPRVRIVLVEIRLDSLNNPKHCFLRNCTLVRVHIHTFTATSWTTTEQLHYHLLLKQWNHWHSKSKSHHSKKYQNLFQILYRKQWAREIIKTKLTLIHAAIKASRKSILNMQITLACTTNYEYCVCKKYVAI